MDQQQKIIVSGILANNDGSVFLAKRPMHKKIAPGKYHLPGGHVEFGEDLQTALTREIQEEFSLDVSVGNMVRSFSYVNADGTIHTIGVTFIIYPETDIPNQVQFDPNDTEEIVWASVSDLDTYLPNHDHDYITLLQYFG